MKEKSDKRRAPKKGFLNKVGTVIGTIGHDLVEGKNKVVEVSHNIITSIKGVPEKVEKQPVKKIIRKVVKKKSAALKKALKKVPRKAAKKSAKTRENTSK